MKVLVIYCHPSNNSFTYKVKNEFIRGLSDGNHEYTLLDLYALNFKETFSESEYLREAFYNEKIEILDDIKEFQQLINQHDALVFIYPVFWGEAPSKLVGWFQRVWTYGFAYGNNASMNQLDKVLMLVTMGGDLNESIRQAEIAAMKVIMFENRIGNLAKEKEMVVFDRMSRDYVNRNNNFNNNLKRAYCLGKNF
ncbi:NAD(P)H-dependent oxidoreductase [Thomasclavelia spiroformis]|uniref:NAD(P)H-dependent oxidoreductase n=1 Tax=Thomasclavelia spiroformis TaxID=29348 RepID=UPI00241F8921|nr:NAD(P)H-dependent oxidoreductase [Thomasclavelia spiroformis]MBS6115172.1 NAD(P)H-dependent oxidoreductase [Thomasclavelia spiroformis]